MALELLKYLGLALLVVPLVGVWMAIAVIEVLG